MYKMGRADLLLLLFQLYNSSWNRRFVMKANSNFTSSGQVAAAACTNFKSQVGSASASELGAIFTPDWQVAAAGANFIVR